DVRIRTGRAEKVGERAGDGGRSLQIESGVGPVQHQLIVQCLKIEANRWRYARRIFDRGVVGVVVNAKCVSGNKHTSQWADLDCLSRAPVVGPGVSVFPEWLAGIR